MFAEFLKDVFNTWVEKVGIILTIIPFIEKIPRVKEWLSDKPILDRFKPILWIIGGVCIVWGFFSAWNDQRQGRVQAEKKLDELTRPQLSGRVEFSWRGDSAEIGGCVVLLNLLIKNDGAPSVASGWKLSVKSASVNIERKTSTVIPDGFTVNTDRNISAVFHANNRLEDKAANAAIQKGVPARGWLMFNLRGVTCAQVGEAETIVYFHDVNDVESSIDFTHTMSGDSAPLYYPGSGDNPFMVPPPEGKH